MNQQKMSLSTNRPNERTQAVTAKKTATKKTTATTRKMESTPIPRSQMNKDFRPGKGLSLSFNLFDEVMGPISGTMADIEVWREGMTDAKFESAMNRSFGKPVEVDMRWGTKWLIRVVRKDNGDEIRVGVTCRPDGTLVVDVRQWYDPNKRNNGNGKEA